MAPQETAVGGEAFGVSDGLAHPAAVVEPAPGPVEEEGAEEAARLASVPEGEPAPEAAPETSAEEAELDDLPAGARLDEWGLPVRGAEPQAWRADLWTSPEEAEETRAFAAFETDTTDAEVQRLEAEAGTAPVRGAEPSPSAEETAAEAPPTTEEAPVDARDLNAYREALGLGPIGAARPPDGPLAPQAGTVFTRRDRGHAAAAGYGIDEDAEAEADARPTLAEQAVPWLIGIVLLLAGMVIVLLALIFAGDGSLAGVLPDPSGSSGASPSLDLLAGASGTVASPSPTPTPAASPTPVPEPSATPLPEYGPLEMVYLGRSAALEPIYLLRHDFTTDVEPEVLAQDPELDVRRFAWAPDGRVGAALLVDRLVSIEPGDDKRPLGDGISAITFGADATHLYAVRITEDGADDVAHILRIDFASAELEELASVTYPRPGQASRGALEDARFEDEGGPVRLFWMPDATLRLWVANAGSWKIDPATTEASALGEASTILWSPDGTQHVVVRAEGATSTLVITARDGAEVSRTEVDGNVSHLRWSPAGDQVAFTRGQATPNGGVLQDLFLWQFTERDTPARLTNTGAGFGAEWLGTAPHWGDAP
jgi:hypothetical protein